ncbi:hypothetical protein Csa_012397 [Cucumis sativus]|uniref:Uncharacterized protein n=1 Tax=Cucumis sativus TaxID=3659 RepID=A0A0A0L2B6_CUCSA|nr:hypothetical protein Csa_012397 [Cucumis sativus]
MKAAGCSPINCRDFGFNYFAINSDIVSISDAAFTTPVLLTWRFSIIDRACS